MIRTRLRAFGHRLLFPAGFVGRVLGPVALASALLLGLGVGGSWVVQRSRTIEAARAQAGVLAASVALGIDPELHEAWAEEHLRAGALGAWQDAPADMRALREALGRTLLASGVNAPIATLRPRENARDAILAAPHSKREGSLERMVTTSQPPRWREAVDYDPAMENALLGGEASSTGVEDVDGEARVRAWAPVVDSFGTVTALVEAQVPLNARLVAVRNAHLFGFFGMTLLLGGGLLIGRRRAQRSLQALGGLAETARGSEADEPFLADDPSAEIMALAEALEGRRELEWRARGSRISELETTRALAEEQRIASEARDAYLVELGTGATEHLSRLARAVGSVPSTGVAPAERAALRGSVLATCELARDLRQLDEHGRIARGERTFFLAPFRLQEAVEAALAPARARAKESDVDLRVIFGNNLPEKVGGDRDALVRALELLSESSVAAVQSTGGGTVSVRIKRLELRDECTLAFELLDSVAGDASAEAYEPFPRSAPKGSRRRGRRDLSLAIAKALVVMQGSEVVVQRERGGTRTAFVLSFGAGNRDPGRSQAEPPAALPRTGQARAEQTPSPKRAMYRA